MSYIPTSYIDSTTTNAHIWAYSFDLIPKYTRTQICDYILHVD